MILWRPIEVIRGVARLSWNSAEKVEKVIIDIGKKQVVFVKVAPEDEKKQV